MFSGNTATDYFAPAKAAGAGSIAAGLQATADGSDAAAYGYNASASGTNSLSLGYATFATGTRSTAIGNSRASGSYSLAAAIASNSSSYGATGANSVAIGQLSKATATNSIAIGDTATSTTANQIALGGTTDTVQISGTYTLPTSDGTNGQVLTTDGSGAVTFADAGGGASLQYFAEDADAPPTAPSATGTYAVAIGDNSTASGIRATAIGGATCSGNSESIAIGSGAVSSANVSTAVGPNSDATSAGSLAIGYSAQAVTGSYATAVSRAYASGADSFAAAIANNTSSYGALTANSIAMGTLCKSTNSTGNVSIGYNNIADGSTSSVVGGSSNQVSAQYGSITGGFGNYITINGLAARVGGYQAKAEVRGKDAYSSGAFSSAGDAQTATIVLRKATTDATASVLTASGGTGGIGNQVILPNNSAYSFSGTIIARESAAAGSDYASWEIKGALLRDANAASTVLGNGIKNKLYASAGASAWDIALTADTTNGGLAITVTGAASTNIRWVATVNTSEVTYA